MFGGLRLPLGVSIPFKRESVSQVNSRHLQGFLSEFQFPSNGKAYLKLVCFMDMVQQEESFNSLQTGKRISRLSIQGVSHGHQVSIPFKRESVSQATFTLEPFRVLERFNSLQTGKRISRASGRFALSNRSCVSIPFKRESVSQENIQSVCGMSTY